jgi:MATE family multidrug resistance protein
MQEIVILAAGLLQHANVTIGALTLAMQVQTLGTMAWIGLAVAAATLVGQRVGARDAQGARRAALVVVVVGLLLAACTGAALTLAPAQLAALCTDVVSIRDFTARLLPYVGAVMLCDATSNALGGACSGLGLQRYAAAAQLIGYALGTAAATSVAFGTLQGAQDGTFALWGGLGLSMLLASALQACMLCRRDVWSRAVAEASERLQHEQHAGGSGQINRAHVDGAGVVTSASRAEGQGAHVNAALVGSGTARSPLLDGTARCSES